VGIGIIAPAENTGASDVVRQEIAEPVDAVVRGPGLAAVAIEAVHGYDADEGARSAGHLVSCRA